MNVSLTTELDQFVHQKVQSGLYTSASEVIREGLRLLKEQDAVKSARLAQLRADIQLGDDQIERGEYTEYTVDELPDLVEDVIARGRKRLRENSSK